MLIGKDGWLVRDRPDDPNVMRLNTERLAIIRTRSGDPLGLVNHYTSVEGSLANMVAMCKRTEKKLTQAEKDAGKRSASWNVLLVRSGLLIQCAPFTRGTWHVKGDGNVLGTRGTVNSLTVGMEIENHGHLVKIGDKFYRDTKASERRPDPKLVVPPERVFGSRALQWWATYSGEQANSAAYLYAALMLRFGWGQPALKLTHEQFNAPRKVDPGPAWTMMAQPAALSHALLLAEAWRNMPGKVAA